MTVFGPYTLDHDTPTTRKAYADIPAGDSQTCTCAMCRNWLTIRDRVLPAEFRDLLDRLGIDYTKEGEIIQSSRRRGDRHLVTVRYHAIGVMLSEPTSETVIIDDMEIMIDWSDGSDSFFEPLRSYPLVSVTFTGYVPCVLEGGEVQV
ncbi:MAG TPA: hypothetical protein VM493_08925 [Vicinamibacterales bacterium]|nr:hypothetical protein [Vicinamibacterales bacterium]